MQSPSTTNERAPGWVKAPIPGPSTRNEHAMTATPCAGDVGVQEIAAVPNLHAEFDLACRNWSPEHGEYLARAGISAKTIFTVGGLGVQRISTAGRLFEPSPGGFPAIILAIYEIGLAPDILDLLAVRVETPGRWWSRLGEAGLILGEDHYLAAVSEGEAVRVFDSPVAWLQGGCGGSAFLDDVEARWEIEHQGEDDAALRQWWEAAA